MKVIEKTTYICPLCGTNYNTNIEAQKCLNKGFDPKVKVGDIVFVKSGFHWFDGDIKWVSNPKVELRGHPEHGNCFGVCCTMQFYYVVTKIDIDSDSSHRPRYHVFTNAMVGKKGHKDGFIFDTPKLVKNPSRYIIEDSKKLLGKGSAWLL